jgi:RNA polymerase sigma factor (sigma-70 family)
VDPRGVIETVWRIESAKVVAALTRLTRDVGVAEELAQDALVAALEQWPVSGVPDNPGAWLTAVAKNHAIESMRRGSLLERKHEEVGQLLRDKQDAAPGFETRLDEDVGDDLLRLMLIACHPVLSADARVALTLRLLGGLTTEEIARAFLVPEPTIAQRIVRAKKTLADAKAAFEVPRGDALAQRLPPVLEAIYLVFNEGYAATRGDDWMRPQLCEDAMRLGRVLSALVPNEPEVHGLVALMELQASRIPARTGPDGEPVLLLEQDRVRWDHTLIRHGLAQLEKAEQLSPSPGRGSYTLQAALAACHARARTPEATDWKRIAALYDLLGAMARSPVVELNRAVAHGMAFSPEAGLAIVDAIKDDPLMSRYHLLFSVRADLLIKLRRFDEAKTELSRAIELAQNASERKLMRERLAALETNQ